MVGDSISLNYRLTIPSPLLNSPQPTSSSLIHSRISEIASTSLSTLRTASSAHSIQENSLCSKIVQIWNDLCSALSSFFSKIYHYVESFFVTPYPQINANMSQEALKKLYWGLGRGDKWRECIDGRYHHLGKDVFDRGTHQGTVERGFIASMEDAFTYVERFLNRRVDADWYLSLHRRTCAHFNGDPSAFLMGQEKVGVFRTSDDRIMCTLSSPNYYVSPQAKAEFEALDASIRQEFGEGYGLGEMVYNDFLQQSVSLNYKVMHRVQVSRIFNKFFNAFYAEIANAASPDDKLTAIAKLQQRLEWLHPVKDGTARTSTALMNKNLTDHGFHPAILDYPHVSSCYTLEQWKQYLQNGLVKWERERDRINSMA